MVGARADCGVLGWGGCSWGFRDEVGVGAVRGGGVVRTVESVRMFGWGVGTNFLLQACELLIASEACYPGNLVGS